MPLKIETQPIQFNDTITGGNGIVQVGSNLTVSNQISANGVIWSSNGNSNNWNQASNASTAYQNASSSFATNAFVNSNFLNLTGGIITGETRINNNLTVFGNLTATGTTTFANTIFSTTSSLSVVHVGTGPALWVGNNGTGDIASFYDIDQNVEVLHVGGNNGSFPNVGVKTGTPNVDFTVNGQISANNTIWSLGGNSDQWNNASNISTAYQNVSGTFATTNFTDSKYLPLSGGEITSDLFVDGNVGIGTNTPLRKYHQEGGKFLVNSSEGGWGQFQLANPTSGEVSVVFAADATVNSDGTIASTDNHNIWAFGAGTYGTSTSLFNIGNNGAGGSIFTIDSTTSNVGIGTTTPVTKLHVTKVSNDVTDPVAIIESTGSQSPFTVRAGGVDQGYVKGDTEGFLALGAQADVVFEAGGFGGMHEVARFTANGNVGIGTTTPTTKLEVNGTITATGGNSDQWNTAYTSWNSASATSIVDFNDTRFAKLSSIAHTLSGSSIYPVLGNHAIGGNNAFIGGGSSIINTGNWSTIAGGLSSSAIGTFTTVGGGCFNNVCGTASTIGGGRGNNARNTGSTVGGGSGNTTSGNYSVVAGGLSNTSTGTRSTVAGGQSNTASGSYSAILGGRSNNTNSQACTFIIGSNITAPLPNYTYVNNISSQGLVAASGGNSEQWNTAYTSWNSASATSIVSFNDTRFAKLSAQVYQAGSGVNSIKPILANNTASGCYSTISGGYANIASMDFSNIAGGYTNTASAYFTNVAGGRENTASGNYSNISGGRCNTAFGFASNVSGGCCNSASGNHSNISGGRLNTVSGYYAFVAGGDGNIVSANFSSILGGGNNSISGFRSSILGGGNNNISGNFSSILGGCNNTSNQSNTFILGSSLSASQANYTYVNNLSSQGNISTNTADESRTNPTISANTLTLDLNTGTFFVVNLNANITTMTFSNPAPATRAESFVLQFIADGTARAVTWPITVKWPSGTAPTLTSTLNKIDTFTFVTHDNGASYFGFISAQNS